LDLEKYSEIQPSKPTCMFKDKQPHMYVSNMLALCM